MNYLQLGYAYDCFLRGKGLDPDFVIAVQLFLRPLGSRLFFPHCLMRC